MADGNDGAAHAAKTPLDHPAANPTPVAADGHVAKLQEAARPTDAAPVVKDSTAQPSDKSLDKVKDTTEKPAVDAYTHLTNAQVAANEIAQYIKAGKKETDTVTVKGPDGKDQTVNVADRIKDLKKVVDSEGAIAVSQSNNIKQADLDPVLQAARNERNALAGQLHLDPNTLSKTSIAEIRKNTTNSGTAAKLDQLAQMQAKVDTYKLWENAPAYTRMLYSSFKAAGLTDPDSGMKKDKNGGLNASQKDVLDAVQLLTEAGTNKDLRNSRLYVEAVATVLPKLENSSDKVQTITKDLQGATKAGASGNTTEQEKLLKDAVAQADQTNTAAIAQMLRDPQFVQSQRNPAVLQDMATNVVLSSTARLQYAQFLMDQGKFADAQGLVLRVKTECPEVMYTADPDHPGQVLYNQSRFVDMDKLDHAAAGSSTVQPNQVRNLLDDYNTAMKNGQDNSKGGAKDILNNALAVSLKRIEQVQDGQKGLDIAQQQLDQRKNDLANKKYLTDEAKTLEQNQIDREQAMIQQQRTRLQADLDDANRGPNVVKLYQAQFAESHDDRDTARKLLAEIKTSSPELAALKDANGQDTFYAQLDKGAQEPGWWDRNWRKVATAGAVVAGLAVGIGTCYLGPGAVLAGVGTTSSLLGVIGAGTAVIGAATAGGALGYLGTHEAIHATGVLSQKVDIGSDLLAGGQTGALVGAGIVSAPLMSAAFGMGPGATIAARAALAGRIGAVGFVASGTQETLSYIAQDPKQRSILGSAEKTLGGTAFFAATPFIPLAGPLVSRIPGVAAASRYVGALLSGAKVAPAVAEVAESAPGVVSGAAPLAAEAPSLAPQVALNLARPAITPGYVLWPASMVAITQGFQAKQDWADADAQGPAYAYDPDGNVGPIQYASIFGPQKQTRGWESDRPGELATIMSRFNDIDPGVSQTDAIASQKPVVPIVNTKSDFTDAQNPPTDPGSASGPNKP